MANVPIARESVYACISGLCVRFKVFLNRINVANTAA